MPSAPHSRFPEFAERVRSARRRHGYSQERCAAEVGVDRRSWVSYEAGRRVPHDAAELRGICDLLGVDPAWLLGITWIERPWPPPEEARERDIPLMD